MTEYDLSKLVKYDEKPPSRYWLKAVNVVARAAVIGFIALIFVFMGEVFLMAMGFDPYTNVRTTSSFGWVAFTLGSVAGCFLEVWSERALHRNYVEVHQGYIVEHEAHGSDEFMLGRCVQVYGYTYANELKMYHHPVGVEKWRSLRVGTLYDFR